MEQKCETEPKEEKPTVENCEVCDSEPHKYKCPRCELKTCSLPCVNIHKKELTCSGQRDSTAYVPMSKFSNLNLLSDYRFLEDIDRAIGNCRRNPMKRFTRFQQQLPPHLYRLKAAASKRKINLQYLPQHFTRHKDNKTMLNYQTQEITWKIDFIFPQGEMIKVCEVVNEKQRLAAVVDKYLSPVDCPEKYKQYLRFYHAAGLSDVLLLLKAERTRDSKAVYELDMFSDINTNLSNKVIIENPVVLVVKKAYKEEYTILDDDVEEQHESVTGKKSGFFGDFSPVGYFDTLEPAQKKRCKGDDAMDSVRASARALRPVRAAEDVDEESEADEEPERSFRRPDLNIPSYDKLSLMRGYTMDSAVNDSGGRVKAEPMSPPPRKLPLATGSLPKYGLISVKKELGGRLASFKPPRDLSLSGASSQINSLKTMINAQPSSKKVFVPNVHVTRRKGTSAPIVNDATNATEIKSGHEKNRKNARNKGNFIQTQGVFSEGLGRATKPKEYSRGSSEATTPQLEKPKLNLNRNTSKKKEDSKMKELLKDDFIDDPRIVPNLNDRPLSLPLLLNPKAVHYKDLDATFESLQVKTEKSEPIDEETFKAQTPKLMKLLDDSSSPRLVIMEFPEELVHREPEKKTNKEIKPEKNSKPQPAMKEDSNHRLSNLGEGLWGTLRILENGAAYIAVGKDRIPINVTRHCPKQNVMSVELDGTSSRGELVNMGRVSVNLTCSSDLTFPTKLK